MTVTTSRLLGARGRARRLVLGSLALGLAAAVPLVPLAPASAAGDTTTFPATPSTLGPVGPVGEQEGTVCTDVAVPVAGFAGAPTAVALRVSMTHTYLGDVEVTLTAPDGTALPIFGDVGRAMNPFGSPSDLGGDYTFADTGAQTVAAAATTENESVLPSGTYRSSAFDTAGGAGAANGLSAAFSELTTANGTWTLSICDTFPREDAGNVSAVALVLTGVDTTGPVVAIDAGPGDGAVLASAPTYTFSSVDDDVATFECAVDLAAYTACTSPSVAAVTEDGAHEFSVRGVDTSGNTGAAVTRSFVLDTTGPVVQVSGPQDDAVVTSSPAYGFSSDDPAAQFECRIDSGAYQACTSPRALSVQPGFHLFAVRASDALGNRGAAVTRAFTLRDLGCERATADLGTAKAKQARAAEQLKAAKKTGNQVKIAKARKKLAAAKSATRKARAEQDRQC